MEILYSDKDIVVCLKPVGLDSEHQVPEVLVTALGGEIYPLHRLDKAVGGVMIYARTKTAAAQFSRLIQENKLVKEYVALAHGDVPPEGDWQDLLFKDSRKNKVFVVERKRAGVKAAKLTYKLLAAGERSLVHIRLYTGRSHQIRVQFASRGFPLVGDKKYGARDKEKEIGLFSCKLTFIHCGQSRSFSALPDWIPSKINL